ncbi:MAG: glycogen debranching protein GlgX [Thermomicrobiales bacterium]
MNSSRFRHSASIAAGKPYPLGATVAPEGVNFALYSEHATSVVLCLFESGKGGEREVPLMSRTGHIWHGFVPGLSAGQLYGYRVDGPWAPGEGHLFNPAKLLVDPYANAVIGSVVWDDSVFGYRRGDHPDFGVRSIDDSSNSVPRSVVIDHRFDWGDDRSPDISLADAVIYETHVKGMTALHPDVPKELRGTYAGFVQPPVVEHLKKLGVTSIEFLPFQAFVDEEFLVESGLRNYWGYNTLGFFAPETRYAAADDPQSQVDEAKTMIRELHRNGFEVILDVVYNHTAEGDGAGPTLSFRGIDNRLYYRLNPGNLTEYVNYSGTGNTLDIGHPAALRIVLDSLRHWVSRYHIDGFRFDLAPALGRDGEDFSSRSSFFHAIYQDPVLSTVKLIAEPWDIGHGGYQVGHFPSGWSEWNDRFRDSIRSFWLGHSQTIGEFALRMTGSTDLYSDPGRGPLASINYVTCHDGFTLRDLVSYEHKHNAANNERNDDGHNHNLSRNFGTEGPTSNPTILKRRSRAQRNLLACVMLAHGVPMILGGDELLRTQKGNNNAYPQDNTINWYDWTSRSRDDSFEAFVCLLTSIRAAYPQLRRDTFRRSELPAAGYGYHLAWNEPDGEDVQPHEWGRQSPRVLQLELPGDGAGSADLIVLLNAEAHSVDFTLPPRTDTWHVVLDTAFGGGRSNRSDEVGSTLAVEGESLVLLASGDGFTLS